LVKGGEVVVLQLKWDKPSGMKKQEEKDLDPPSHQVGRGETPPLVREGNLKKKIGERNLISTETTHTYKGERRRKD